MPAICVTACKAAVGNHNEPRVVSSGVKSCRGAENVTLRDHQSATMCPTKEDHGENPVFQFEEECHEAIIDTGARAVIGSQRLKGLIESCGLKGEVKVIPSKVVFRFGNAGTLQGTTAVFFPRKTGGWIRVEVVPGQTPFLLSNSVLKSLEAMGDVDGRMLWFKDCEHGVPLKPCRKNLMSVDFGKILSVNSGISECKNEIHVVTQGHPSEDPDGVTEDRMSSCRGTNFC